MISYKNDVFTSNSFSKGALVVFTTERVFLGSSFND